jgi:hypothetical protein
MSVINALVDAGHSHESELFNTVMQAHNEETTRLRQQLEIAVHKLELLEAQHTGQAGSTKLSDCMAIMAKQSLAQIRELEK